MLKSQSLFTAEIRSSHLAKSCSSFRVKDNGVELHHHTQSLEPLSNWQQIRSLQLQNISDEPIEKLPRMVRDPATWSCEERVWGSFSFDETGRCQNKRDNIWTTDDVESNVWNTLPKPVNHWASKESLGQSSSKAIPHILGTVGWSCAEFMKPKVQQWQMIWN